MAQGPSNMIGVLIADISGTTKLYHKLGTVEAGYAVERGVKRMERGIETNGGKFLNHAADQLVAIFSGAGQAIAAAVEMQRRVDDLLPISGIKLSIRIGVHAADGSTDKAGSLLFDSTAKPERNAEVAIAESLAVECARRLLIMSGPGQILTCGSVAQLLPLSVQQTLWSCEGLVLAMPDGSESQVYQVQWASPDDVLATQRLDPGSVVLSGPAVDEAVEAIAANGRFCVRVAGKAYLLDDRTTQLAIGRDKKNDIVIKDPKASRQHARIEQRGAGRYVVVDLSTNGTFVLDGTAETRVRGGELLLGCKGQIAFGHSPRDRGAECVEFERV